MFVLILVLLSVMAVQRNDSFRQARLRRNLAALHRAKMEAVFAARRAQFLTDRIGSEYTLPAAGQAQVVIDGTRISVSGPVQVVVKGHPVCSVEYSETPAAVQADSLRGTPALPAVKDGNSRVCESAAGGWVQFLS